MLLESHQQSYMVQFVLLVQCMGLYITITAHYYCNLRQYVTNGVTRDRETYIHGYMKFVCILVHLHAPVRRLAIHESDEILLDYTIVYSQLLKTWNTLG